MRYNLKDWADTFLVVRNLTEGRAGWERGRVEPSASWPVFSRPSEVRSTS